MAAPRRLRLVQRRGLGRGAAQRSRVRKWRVSPRLSVLRLSSPRHFARRSTVPRAALFAPRTARHNEFLPSDSGCIVAPARSYPPNRRRQFRRPRSYPPVSAVTGFVARKLSLDFEGIELRCPASPYLFFPMGKSYLRFRKKGWIYPFLSLLGIKLYFFVKKG